MEMNDRALHRLETEHVIWLTTVSPAATPQPRPVWFVWDGTTVLIYSHAKARKLAHIARNPNVSLHFNTDADGYDVQVILGKARLDVAAPLVDANGAYLHKYSQGIRSIGMDAAIYARTFSVAIRVDVDYVRSLEPIPDAPQVI